MVNPGLYVKADSMDDCMLNMFRTAKISTLCGLTKGVNVDVSCL